MLGAAQADALGAEARGPRAASAPAVGVGPHRRACPARISSAQPQDDVELRAAARRGQLQLAEHDLAGRAVERDHVALAAR